MAEFRFTDDQWRAYQAMPEQGYSHRHWLEHQFNTWLVEHDNQIDAAILGVLEDAEQRRNGSDYPESHYGQHLDGQARGASDALTAVRTLVEYRFDTA